MDLFSTLIYGLIQGITEFLPISSSAHLAILPEILKIKDPGVTFDLMMHIGTALSIIVYFRKKIFAFLKNKIIFINYSVALGSTFVVLVFIKNLAENYGRNPIFIAINLIVFGFLMYFADRNTKIKSSFEKKISIKNTILIGMAQAFAVFPGVSRSGITITLSRFFSYSREDSFTFSFLLSLPIILAGAGLKLFEVHDFDILPCLYGVLFSFIFGLIAIHFLMTFVTKKGVLVFAIYRLILGVILILYFM